jgi:hypothetical protein
VTSSRSEGIATESDHSRETPAQGPGRVFGTHRLHADLNDYVPIPASFDLVSAQFMHLPPEQRELLHRRLAASVAPGGTFLVVGHHPSDLPTSVPRPPLPELFFNASEIAAALDAGEWVVLVDEARARPALDRDGHTVTIHDAVMRAQRNG